MFSDWCYIGFRLVSVGHILVSDECHIDLRSVSVWSQVGLWFVSHLFILAIIKIGPRLASGWLQIGVRLFQIGPRRGVRLASYFRMVSDWFQVGFRMVPDKFAVDFRLVSNRLYSGCSSVF